MKKITLVLLMLMSTAAWASEKSWLELGMKRFNVAAEHDKAGRYFDACIQYRTALLHFDGVTDKNFEKSKKTVRSLEQNACRKAGV